MSGSPANAAAILLAGGSSRRMQGATEDKTLAFVGGKPLLAHSIEAFARSGAVDTLVIVHRDAAQRAAIEPLVEGAAMRALFAPGGRERQDSVWAGLRALPDETEIVLIHDGARPLIAPEAIVQVAEAARSRGAACLARPISDTIKCARPSGGALIPTTLDRSLLWAMETPQAFRFPIIRDAYRRVIEQGRSITDDLSAIEPDQTPVVFVQNPGPNPKLTTAADLAYIEFLLSRAPANQGAHQPHQHAI